MPLPSERLSAATTSAAAHAVFRLVAVWLGFGVFDLLGSGLHWLIVTTVHPGDGSGPLGGVTRLYGRDGTGDTWVLLFVLLTVLFLAAEAFALAWALRVDRSTSPVVLLSLGGAGLVARLLSFFASIAVSASISSTESVEKVMSFSIAGNVAAVVHTTLYWILMATVLVVLFVRVLRQPRLDEREGPYREPAS